MADRQLKMHPGNRSSEQVPEDTEIMQPVQFGEYPDCAGFLFYLDPEQIQKKERCEN